MAKQDFYATLGVSKNAGADDLKKAYRKLAMQFHPDRNPGDKVAEARFKDIREAYDILKDDQKRAAYDRFGHAAFEGGGPGAGGFNGFNAGMNDFQDIFNQMFGDGRRGGGNGQNGNDVLLGVEISLEDAFSGRKADIKVPTKVSCDACAGSGSADKDKKPENCVTCRGTGKIRTQQGMFVMEMGCPHCGGRGKTIRNPCRACQGTGSVQRERALTVSIPAGVADGNRIRLGGEGGSGGDLYIQVAVRPHALFRRDGANIFCQVPVRFTLAALGGDIEVPVIDGTRAKVKIPAGSQNGDQLRMRGKGFSVLNRSDRGDMHIQIMVETPRELTKRQRELLEEFDAETEKARMEGKGFFGKAKDFFEGRA